MAEDMDDDGELLMGCWDCPACGAVRLRGDAYQCGTCGSPRPQDVEFYLPDDAEVITSEEGIQQAEAGVDWQCAFCQSWMPATDNVCRNCKASVAESTRKQQTEVYDGDAPQQANAAGDLAETAPYMMTLDNTQAAASPRSNLAANQRDTSRRPSRPFPLVGCLVPLAIAGVLAAVMLVYGGVRFGQYRAFEQKLTTQQSLVASARQKVNGVSSDLQQTVQQLKSAETAVEKAKDNVASAELTFTHLQDTQQSLKQAQPATVVSHLWKVTLDIQEVATRPGEGWSHPAGAIDVTSKKKVHHHKKVLDHVDTLYRTETYREQDGYDTETYTERVRSGSRRVQSGFRTENLGNGRFRRTPKYRNEPVYRIETRTRRKPRIVTKTRRVPYTKNVYRQDPVHKPWYTYRTRYWKDAPAMARSGEGMQVQDPQNAPPENPPMEIGARRVSQRRVAYSLEVETSSGSEPMRTVGVSKNQWESLEDNSTPLLAGNQLLTQAQHQTQLANVQQQLLNASQQVATLKQRVTPLANKIEPLEGKLPQLQSALQQKQSSLTSQQQKLEAIRQAGY